MARLVNVRTKKAYPLAADEVVIGRHPSCHVQVLEKQVSRKHCFVIRSAEGWVLRDSGSMLGTYLNGELLTSPYCLEPGDAVKVGTETFLYEETKEDAHKPMTLRPLSDAGTDELVPFDIPGRVRRRSKRLPVAIGLSVAVVAVGALLAIVLLTRQGPTQAVFRAAELLRGRQARELWGLLSDERRQALAFEEFREELRAIPDEALQALQTLKLGVPYHTERGVVVPVYVQAKGEQLAGDVVLYRQGGSWRIHTAPVDWLRSFEE